MTPEAGEQKFQIVDQRCSGAYFDHQQSLWLIVHAGVT
jgi:hypothetical protein